MKALAICQPYAHLIIVGKKFVENRTWPTQYRGPILIHAGKSVDWLACDKPKSPDAVDENSGFRVREMAFGAIVGVAQMLFCLTKENIQRNAETPREKWSFAWDKIAEHEHTEGPWCWVLSNVRRFQEPIPYKGALGLFEVPDELVAEQLAKAQVAA